jgi:hypothetical protein
MTLTKGTDGYTINQTAVVCGCVSGCGVEYTGFTITKNDIEEGKLQGTVTIDSYYAKHWETVQHAAYDRYGTALPPAQTEVPLTSHVGHTYACTVDVTQLLKDGTGNGQYAVRDVQATLGPEGGGDYATRCFSGWSLVILYKSESETAHQFYLYDPIHNAADCPFMVTPVTDYPEPQPTYHDVPFTLKDFHPPEGTVEGKVTYFVGEGDPGYSGDYVGFKGASEPSYTYLSDYYSPVSNVMNTVSSTGEKGIDVDTYDIWSEVGSDTEANVQLRTQDDRWYLVYMILSFKTNEVPKAEYAFNVASVTYQYELGAQ